ncbi:hypothetical protein BHM03_00045579 [Ensete ventricosum]|nr:hypothetical protein BHM03_00045579 [Ensete ventricosum]
MVPQRRDFRGVIDPLLSLEGGIGRKRGRGGGQCKGKLQVPRQGVKAEAKKLHETYIDGLLIKIAESEGLRVDAGVYGQRSERNRRWRRSYDVLAEAILEEIGRVYKATDSRAMGSAAPWYRKGGTSVELSIPCSHWRESIGRKRGRGGGQCKGKLQVPRQGVKAEAKKLHETYIDGLLIKIVESEGLRVDPGVLD